ncbi:uncharacterized protein LOC118425564 [Branchiostoma floridae]|uniref:Uncharacterized protein LOC118425564 n=1 Tax=Branchiostoma floridae TaxID=7739 RepID=A0A9J7LWF0_BRAFL|nr:uncharacterized protein LOC118425564 [Branchiostoma floridae]
MLLSPGQVEKYVPRGLKEDVAFLVDNCDNHDRRLAGKKSELWDDCGSWTRGTSPKTLLFYNGYSTQIVTKNSDGLYCTLKTKDGRRKPVPLNPQPQGEDILELQRNYSTSKASESYKRRVSWLNSFGDTDIPHVALYEYTGTYPGDQPHGKSSDPDSVYVRCRGETMEKIGAAARDVVPSIAFRTLKDQLPLQEQPTNIQQVKNKRYREATKRRGAASGSGQNVADHVQQLEAPDGHPFARQVIRGYNKETVVIVYFDEQIQDMKRFCCTSIHGENTVLGVDKTFNLGPFHVTVTNFKHLAVVRRDTGEHPIFFGPMFVHGGSKTVDYSVFFDHIRSVLDSPPSMPVVGSDNERALRTAIGRAWPGCHQLYCHRHIRKNCSEYLQRKVGMSDAARQPVIDAIFGKNGITAATSRVVFEGRLQHAEDLADAGNFGPYFREQVKPLLQSNFNTTSRTDFPIKTKWTNNNAESANHILKVAVGWKPQSLLGLVQKLSEVVRGQYQEVERAIINTGEYKLTDDFTRFRIHRDTWCTLSEKEREAHLRRFGKEMKKPRRLVISTDGRTGVMVPSHGGKKKGQVTRKRANRTKTF